MLHHCGRHGDTTGPVAPPCSCGFSIFFPGKQPVDESNTCTMTSSSSSTLVDCTLSLGTPSTRQSTYSSPSIQRTFCWDMISQSSKHASRGTGTGDGNGNSNSASGDPLLLARRCANCDTTSTPLWRNGPRGPKSLCNACGIRYKKEERRAAASTPPPVAVSPAGFGAYQRPGQHPWSCYVPTAPVTRADEDEPYLSWRLNVVPSLFQYQ